MAAAINPAADTSSSRKRKAHKKSRGGCSNCKLRRVKCDEQKPKCHKCVEYGVSCDYAKAREAGGLQLAGEASFRLQGQAAGLPQGPPSPPDEQLLRLQGTVLGLHESSEGHYVSEDDVQVLQRFLDRTVYTVGTAATVHLYRDNVLSLAADHDFLTHIVLGLTLMHDRYLAGDRIFLPSQRESFHIYHGTGIFKSKISKPILPEERDPLWGAAALLGAITHASINESDPEECWPLRPPSQSDMDWIYMGEGKKAVWELTDPMREDSIWRPGMTFEHNGTDELPKSAQMASMDALYPFIKKISDLDDSSANAGDDPYYTAVSILTRLLPLEVNHSTIMYFLSFMGHMDSRYRDLLKAKDPKALLLLCWWLAKLMIYPAWWTSRRAKLECQAICIYLERYHGSSSEIMEVLTYPKTQCGLLAA